MPRRLAPELSHAEGVVHLQVRIAPDLHAVIRVAAASRGQSVQRWMLEALRAAVLRQAHGGDATVRAALNAREEG